MRLIPIRIKLLRFIDAFCRKHGYSPSMREMEDAAGMTSTSQVSYHMDWLRVNGYISYVPQAARTVRVIVDMDLIDRNISNRTG